MSKADEEKKSYAAVFLLGVGLLLATAVWVVWDDQISRRPWKKYQYDFSQTQIDRAKADVEAERKRLEESAEYQKVVEDLEQARRQLATGDDARQLSELASRENEARVAFGDAEFELRMKKSEIEEAWYEVEHAQLAHHDVEGPKRHLAELERERIEIERSVSETQAKLDQILSEKAEIRSVVANLEKKKEELEMDLERLKLKVEGLIIEVGPLDFPKIPKIEQVVLEEFDRNAYNQPVARVDRCTSCHAGINKEGFEDLPHPYKTHPDRKLYLGTHAVEKFGCTPCHQGQGAAVNSPEQAHGHVKYWLDPMYEGDDVQASCIGCHANVRLERAEKIALGEQLFEQVGCVGCHLVEGYGEVAKVGPYLRRVSAKVDAEWLVRWVQEPHEFRPRTKMPNFYFSEEEAEAVAGYILSVSQEESGEWLQSHETPAGVDAGNAALVARGEELANSLGCRGCHGFEAGESPAMLGDMKDVAPNLSNVAEKTNARWMYHWLKNPRGYSPESRMPSLRLTDDEARALVSYLLTLGERPGDDAATRAKLLEPENVARGEGLVRKYGCAGCHNITGHGGRVARRGRADGVRLEAARRALLRQPHRHPAHLGRLDVLQDQRAAHLRDRQRIEQVMPQFDLADEDIDALRVFLKSRTEHKMPDAPTWPQPREADAKSPRAGASCERYNCVGCHVIEGKGARSRPSTRSPTSARRSSTAKGAKVQQPLALRLPQAAGSAAAVAAGAHADLRAPRTRRRPSSSSTSPRRTDVDPSVRPRRPGSGFREYVEAASCWPRTTTSPASPVTSRATASRKVRRKGGPRPRAGAHRLNPELDRRVAGGSAGAHARHQDAVVLRPTRRVRRTCSTETTSSRRGHARLPDSHSGRPDGTAARAPATSTKLEQDPRPRRGEPAPPEGSARIHESVKATQRRTDMSNRIDDRTRSRFCRSARPGDPGHSPTRAARSPTAAASAAR
jgi:mono/diheme cytochrome c family protein